MPASADRPSADVIDRRSSGRATDARLGRCGPTTGRLSDGEPMRRLVRLIAPVLAVAAIVVAGSSSALAASPSSASLDANWCFQDASTQYCFDIDGTVHYLDNKVGSSVTIN